MPEETILGICVSDLGEALRPYMLRMKRGEEIPKGKIRGVVRGALHNKYQAELGLRTAEILDRAMRAYLNREGYELITPGYHRWARRS